MSEGTTTEAVDVEHITRLRKRVLGWRDATIALDQQESTAHFAAVTRAGEIVGCASAGLSNFPLPPLSGRRALRFWAVAVQQDYRGRGIGAKLLEKIYEHGHSLDADIAWANARISAISYYLRFGFREVGPRFDDPLNGQIDGRLVVDLR